MKAVVTIIIAMLAGPMAGAESIATGGVLDPIARIFTSCDNCKVMEKQRTETFVPAHRNARLRAAAAAKMDSVYEHGERLSLIAQNDRVSLRGAHYANEITAFFFLASDALPYAGDLQIAETIAYLNTELGSRSLFDKVLNDEVLSRPENACRKDFLTKAVALKECEQANEIEAEQAVEAKRAPKARACGRLNSSVSACEARQASRIK